MSAPAAGAAWTPDEIASAAQLACLLEASAPKPGNVSPGRAFARAIRSCTDFTGHDGPATSTPLSTTSVATGTNAFTGS